MAPTIITLRRTPDYPGADHGRKFGVDRPDGLIRLFQIASSGRQSTIAMMAPEGCWDLARALILAAIRKEA